MRLIPTDEQIRLQQPGPAGSLRWGLGLLFALLVLTACRSPFPPALGSGQLVFEGTTVHVLVRDCPGPIFTEAVRAEVERSEPADGLTLIFHRGETRYLGRTAERGYAMVHCDDWAAIPWLAAIDRAEVSP